MRVPRIAPIILLILAACVALATDYRVSINASPDQVAKAKVLRIYGFKFQKGDRVVAVEASRSGAATGFKVSLDGSGDGNVVAAQHSAQGFGGKVLAMAGQSPAKSANASVEKVVAPVPQPAEAGGLLAGLKGFVSSPLGYAIMGCFVLLVVAAFLFRPKSSGRDSWTLPNRRKSIDESLKDICRRLEQMDDNQRELVRKPPVLRSFKHQIDNFDSRLKHLEGLITSFSLKTADGLGALDRGQNDLRAKADQSDTKVKEVSNLVEVAQSSVASLKETLSGLAEAQRASASEALSQQGKHAMEIQSRLAALDKAQTEMATAHSEVRDLAGSLSEKLDAGSAQTEAAAGALSQKFDALSAQVLSAGKSLETAHAGLAKLSEALAKVQAGVEDNGRKEVDLAPVFDALAQVQADLAELKSDQVKAADALGALAGRQSELHVVQQALADLGGKIEYLSKAQEAAAEKVVSLEQELPTLRAKDYDNELNSLSASVDGAKAALCELAQEVVPEMGAHSEKLAALIEAHEKFDAALSGLAEKIGALEVPSPEAELAGLADQLTAQRAALEALAKGLEGLERAATALRPELEGKIESLGKSHASRADQLKEQVSGVQSSLAQKAEELQNRIAEISARTDQREAILLSLQNRVSDSEGQVAGAAEVLPVVADLRLELKALASDQAKVGAAIEAMSQSVSKLGADTEERINGLKEDQNGLAAALAEVGKTLDGFAGPSSDLAPLQAIENPRLEASLAELAQAVQQWKEQSEADRRSLEERLSNLHVGEQSTDGLPVFDDSKFVQSIESLATAFAEWKQQTQADREDLENRISALAASPVPAAAPVVDLTMVSEALNGFAASLAEWKGEADASRGDLEERLRAEVAKLEQHRMSPVELPEVEEAHASSPEEPVHFSEPLVIDMESIADLDYEKPAEPDLGQPADLEAVREEPAEESEEAAEQGGWHLAGASAARRWSASVDRALSIVASDKNQTALTPTVTPSTDHKVGPVIYVGKRLVYGHGEMLKGTWPGKNASSAVLQQDLPLDDWRLAALEGNAFCVEEDQVEIVSLTTWQVISRFSGTYIDQVCTHTHWVGLSQMGDRLKLDYRNLQGRQLGEQVALPFRVEEAKAMAADGEKIFLGTKDGRVFREELGEVKEIVGAQGGELVSMSVHKAGLVLLVRVDGHDEVRTFNAEGKTQKQLVLDFEHALSHPVLMGDKMYLVDAGQRNLVVCNLKKADVAARVDLPGDSVSSFCGLFKGEHHALLMTIGEQGDQHAKLIAIEPKSGSRQAICDVNEPQIHVLPADDKVAVATSTFYQNTIRVFDPFRADQSQKAA